MVEREREYVLAGLLVGVGLLTLAILWEVWGTVFFAITVAYVLFPLRQMLVRRGVGRRVAAAISTTAAILVVVVLVAPLIVVLYLRRGEALAFLNRVPEEIVLEVSEFTYVVNVDGLLPVIRDWVTDLAVGIARAAPVLGLKVFLFVILVYALLMRPAAPRAVLFRPIPNGYHGVVLQLHRRVRSTLYALYVLQVATAVATFAVGYVVFALLGYKAALGLAVIAAILQFIPVIGPSVLVVALAALEFAAGDAVGGAVVAVTGLVLIGFLPDALIRPRLASLTTGMPGSLYFVGFTGGVLSLGLVGFIAGPLVIAVLSETIDLLADERGPVQQQLT